MDPKEFVDKIQRYYGKYPEGQKAEVWKYIRERSARYLALLYDRVILGYSSKWKTPPDVATFEEYRKAVLEEIESVPPPFRPQITDGSEVDCREEIAELFGALKAKVFGRPNE